uniref:Torsin-1A n=1 Tax=Lygus hesperus TaxID=30085 RepID=A0A0A9XKC0_LYGHE
MLAANSTGAGITFDRNMKSKRYPLICIVFLSAFVGLSDCGWLTDSFYSARSYFGEVCHSPSISFDATALERNLENAVFGQPFLQKIILPLLKLHLSEAPGNRKALVFSFHGTPGSGKNYVAKIIAENIYKTGMDSNFVHLFKPVLHFSGRSPEILKLRLQEWIVGNVTKCEKQMFIFDEVNDMPEGILEAVKGFIDYNPRFGGLDFSKCIFIFLSNIAMVPINQRVLELWQGGVKQREMLEYEDFSQIIIEHSFNVDGGFKKCKLISSRLIDAFVPFLPLERPHVENCIRVIAAEYSNAPISLETINSIMEKVEFVPEGLDLYSSHGCKNLETPIKLALIRHNYKLKEEL